MEDLVTLEELQYEQELLENLTVEDIRRMLDDEVIYWVRGSAASVNRSYGMYYGLLDYKGKVRYLEGSTPDATAYAAILAGIYDGVKQLKSPVRFHVITPTDIFFKAATKPGRTDEKAAKIQEILHELKQKNCQLSYSKADGETIRKWVMSHSSQSLEPKENKYKRIIYRECLKKVSAVLAANGASPELIRKVQEITPDP